jgi:hypothetical protein
MFPNVRLMIVAILAAIAGIGCGLGLFATFRVNHEPLARLAEGSSPLQLAFDNRALGWDAQAPLEARLPVNGAAKPISAPGIIATPSPAPNPAASPALSPAPNPASSAGASAVPQPSEADSSIAGDSSVQQESAGAAPQDHSNMAGLAVAVPAEQSSVTPEAPGQRETAAALSDQQPAAAVPTPPAAEQTAAVNAAAEDQQSAAKPTKSGVSKAAKPAARAPRAAPARRAAKTVRARRAVAKVAPQPTYQYAQPTYSQPTYTQPTYTWADGAAQTSQSVKRVQIKRHRAAKKTTPAAQSNTSAATAGLSGTQ